MVRLLRRLRALQRQRPSSPRARAVWASLRTRIPARPRSCAGASLMPSPALITAFKALRGRRQRDCRADCRPFSAPMKRRLETWEMPALLDGQRSAQGHRQAGDAINEMRTSQRECYMRSRPQNYQRKSRKEYRTAPMHAIEKNTGEGRGQDKRAHRKS
jgi:hypothetical protein